MKPRRIVREMKTHLGCRPQTQRQLCFGNSANTLPKIVPVRGSLHLEWKRCGRPNCRCQTGRLHGPYYARHWREDGRQRKAYVKADNVAATLLAIEAHHKAFPPTSRMIAVVESALKPSKDQRGRL